MLVQDVLRDAANGHENLPAVEGHDGMRSFAELLDRASRLASGLRGLGLRPGDRVLEAVPNSCGLLESDFALALAGLVRVPLNPRLGPEEWRGIAEDSGARALLIDPRIHTADGAFIPPHTDVEIIIEAGASRELDTVTVDELIAGGDLETDHRASPDDLVGLAYSSGTTGRPKGARRTHRMRLAAGAAMSTHAVGETLDGAPRYLHAGPAIHTSGLFILPMLSAGVPQHMLDHARPDAIVETVRDRRITHMAVVPTVVSALAEVVAEQDAPLDSLRMLAYAGAPMQARQLRAAFESLTPNLVQYYGLVEAMPPLTVLSPDDHALAMSTRPALAQSAGKLVPAVEFRIDGDADSGEVLVRGDAVTTGYWNADARDDLGKSVVDGWLRTGDLGRIEDGYLWLTDRLSDMIISGGYNIFPSEVENAVAEAPHVAGCAAVGAPDPRWGQRLIVAYRSTAGMHVDPADLTDACRRLAPHKRPKEFIAVADLPLGATGKVNRRAVASLLAQTPPQTS